MFFAIGPRHESNYSNYYRCGNFFISTDEGWAEYEDPYFYFLYKGYADLNPLQHLLHNIVLEEEPTFTGNFCVLAYDKTSRSLRICTDRYRGFPLYFSRLENKINNLAPLDHVAWGDSLVELNDELEINYTTFDVIGPIDDSPIELDEMLKIVDDILVRKTQQLIDNNQLPIKGYISGGIDSLLVYSYLKRCNVDFELIRGEHIDYDEFWLKNSGTLKKYWGYTQIHHWNQPCILTSGTPGDEFMLRSPATCNLWLMYHGTSILDLLKQPEWKDSYHHVYFSQQKYLDLFQSHMDHPIITPDMDKQQVIRLLCNNIINDWQHWHLGQTLTWTPLRDIEIAKLFFRLPLEVQKTQMMNSDISRQLVENNTPRLTNLISDQKNSGNLLKNMVNFFKNQPVSKH